MERMDQAQPAIVLGKQVGKREFQVAGSTLKTVNCVEGFFRKWFGGTAFTQRVTVGEGKEEQTVYFLTKGARELLCRMPREGNQGLGREFAAFVRAKQSSLAKPASTPEVAESFNQANIDKFKRFNLTVPKNVQSMSRKELIGKLIELNGYPSQLVIPQDVTPEEAVFLQEYRQELQSRLGGKGEEITLARRQMAVLREHVFPDSQPTVQWGKVLSLSSEARAVTKMKFREGLKIEQARDAVTAEDERWQKSIEPKRIQTRGLASLPPIVAGREQIIPAMRYLLQHSTRYLPQHSTRFSIGLRGLNSIEVEAYYEINAISDDSKEITMIDEKSMRKVTISMDDFFELNPQTIRYAGSAGSAE